MLTIDEALKAFEIIEGLKAREIIPLINALDRVLASEISSKVDHPPFEKSAMDGFAVNSADPTRDWCVLETIAAGQLPKRTLEPGCCSKIMTGSMLPKGADCVVIIEHTEETKTGVGLVRGAVEAGANICRKGEDARAGDLVVSAGQRITPQLLGSIAACGHDTVEVHVRPRLTILTTGDEIVLPGIDLLLGQIYNSNAFSLMGQYRKMGMDVRFGGGAVDTLDGLKLRIDELLADSDVLVISGGVSMGDFDFVPQAIQELGGTIHFAKVAIKPGKPTLFATLNGRLIFGLPGNPVSTFIVTEVLVKPALNRLLTLEEPPREIVCVLSHTIRRKKPDRLEYIPVRWQGGEVEAIEYHGSAHLLALPRANGLLALEIGITEMKAGSQVRVRLI